MRSGWVVTLEPPRRARNIDVLVLPGDIPTPACVPLIGGAQVTAKGVVLSRFPNSQVVGIRRATRADLKAEAHRGLVSEFERRGWKKPKTIGELPFSEMGGMRNAGRRVEVSMSYPSGGLAMANSGGGRRFMPLPDFILKGLTDVGVQKPAGCCGHYPSDPLLPVDPEHRDRRGLLDGEGECLIEGCACRAIVIGARPR